MASLEEIEARHKKELKALDGEKRAELKKAKGTAGKGKKAKEKLAEVESEFETKLKELQEKHAKETSDLQSSSAEKNEKTVVKSDDAQAATDGDTDEKDQREKKLAKALRKREKAREKERERELQIEKEKREAGPSLRQIEVEQIQRQLTPLGLAISEVQADGNCLYRAVAAHCNSTYQEMRNLCAQTLREKESEFAPFCEFDADKAPDFDRYVERVEKSSDWGGHLELRVLSAALQKPIWIYSAQRGDPLIVSCEEQPDKSDDEPIRLSYHLHYYALGEHYNQVIKES